MSGHNAAGQAARTTCGRSRYMAGSQHKSCPGTTTQPDCPTTLGGQAPSLTGSAI